MRQIRTDPDRSPAEKLPAILELGANHFGVENGHLVAIDPAEGIHTTAEVSSPHPKIEPGATEELCHTYCRQVIAEDRALALEDARSQGWAEDPAYEQFGLDTYLGMKVIVSGELYGTVCFVDRPAREKPFSESDIEDLELITWTIEHQLEQRAPDNHLVPTRAHLETLFEEDPDMVHIHDRAGNFIVSNSRLCEQTGYAKEELSTMNVWELYRKLRPDQARRICNEMQTGDQRRWKGRYRRSDGSSFPVEVDLRCLDIGGADRFVAIARDISDRERRERRLRAAKQEAEQASRVKSSLLENMSHEFRTPLAAVLGYADLLAEETAGRARKFAQRIREGGARLQETLETVLNLAQLEGEGLKIEPREIDVAEAVREAAEAQEPKAQRKGLTLRVDGLDGPVQACTDPSVLSRITTHLVSNGIKFTEDGMVEVVLTASEDTLVLKIRDTGIGISEETREDVFQPFFQESTGMAREYEGSGLGLTITRHLVEEAGGTIDLDSDEHGTTVTVSLPRDFGNRDEHGSASPTRAGDHDQLPGSRRVLLVEDDASMRELVGEMVPNSIDLSVAAGPEEALTEIRSDSLDVILLDINLKADMNGVDLLRHIRSETESPGPKVIAMTAYATPGDEESFRAEGFDGYLPKPFSADTLRHALIQVLEETAGGEP